VTVSQHKVKGDSSQNVVGVGMFSHMISYIISLLSCWVGGFILHECCHALEASRQGAKPYIEFWWHGNLPSMRCGYSGTIKNRSLFSFAGGFYSGCILLFFGWLFLYVYLPLAYGLLVVGAINFVYAFYEVRYIDKLDRDEYMRKHYIIYIVTFIVVTIIFKLWKDK